MCWQTDAASRALTDGWPTSSTASTAGFIGDSPMVAHHCYNVISTRTDTSGARFMTIRNPWGSDHADPRHWTGADDGVLTVRFEAVNSKVLEYVACRTSL